MPKPITDKYGNLLKPIRIDRNTLLYVAPKDATQARAEKFRKDAERSQKMALNRKYPFYYIFFRGIRKYMG